MSDDDDLDDALLEDENNKDEEYFDEDDFEPYAEPEPKLRQSPIIKPTNNNNYNYNNNYSNNNNNNNNPSHSIHKSNSNSSNYDNDNNNNSYNYNNIQNSNSNGGDDDNENIFDDEDNPHSSQLNDEEDSQGVDFENSMTLESYMEEFFKRKYAEDTQNNDQQSPEAVDPQGLDGVSPGPGQRHINGTDSPFRFDVECFTPRSTYSSSSNSRRLQDTPGSDSKATLANILSKVQDVQTQLIEISTNGLKIDPTALSPIVPNSPIISNSKKKTVKNLHEMMEPSADSKIDILKKELRKKNEELRESQEKINTLQNTIIDQSNRMQLLESDLKEERARCNKAIKQKNKTLQTLQKMSQELEKYNTIMNAMNELKTREEILHEKMKELTLQNHDLTTQLKGSMARELEWRTLYRTEQQQQQQQHHNHNLPTKLQPLLHDPLDMNAQQSRLSSHRSLPDNDSNSQLPKVPYERKSHTERREKKHKNSGKQLPKIPKKDKY